jgi:hypothetical protein
MAYPPFVEGESFLLLLARPTALPFAREGREGLMQLWDSTRLLKVALPRVSRS